MHPVKIFLTLFVCTFSFNDLSAQSYFKSEYKAVWERAAEYTIEVAQAMPADKYSFKPVGTSMSFHEQLVHIIGNIAFLSSRITGDRPDFFKSVNSDSLSKEQLITVLQESFSHIGNLIDDMKASAITEKIEFRGEQMTKENIFYLIRDHTAHHRGQAILYLRMNNIHAPMYRGW